MKQHRMSMERLRMTYWYKRIGIYGDEVTVADLERTVDLLPGESFGRWYDRQKGKLDLFDECVLQGVVA